MRKLVTIAAMAAVLGIIALPSAAMANDEDHCRGDDGTVNLILGSRDADRLVGTDCDDAIFGFGGDDRIRGKYGTDLLRGGRGDDRISDPSFEGRINGGSGFDTCIVGVFSEIAVVRCEIVIEV